MLIACIYLPNGNPQPGPKFDYKLAWFDRLIAHAAGIKKAKVPAVLASDFNVMPTDFDIYPTRSYDDNALLQPAPRAAYQRLLKEGWTDASRKLHLGCVLGGGGGAATNPARWSRGGSHPADMGDAALRARSPGRTSTGMRQWPAARSLETEAGDLVTVPARATEQIYIWACADKSIAAAFWVVAARRFRHPCSALGVRRITHARAPP